MSNGLLGEIGTIEWSRRTKGILGRGERARYIAAFTLALMTATPRLMAAKAGMRGSGPDPSELTPPDTPFAKDVVEACTELGPMVLEHSYRSYIYGRALGVANGIECDEEALFAATMFHDYGFKGIEQLTDRCFTAAGAESAEEFLEGSSLTEGSRHDVLDAITLHFNPTVRPQQGAVQHLTHDGVLLDVVGARSWELDPAGVRRVAERHPRHGFTVDAEPVLRGHVGRVPGCRVAAAFRAGFGQALTLSAWRADDRATSAGAPTIATP
jgi:hypothetical protein